MVDYLDKMEGPYNVPIYFVVQGMNLGVLLSIVGTFFCILHIFYRDLPLWVLSHTTLVGYALIFATLLQVRVSSNRAIPESFITGGQLIAWSLFLQGYINPVTALILCNALYLNTTNFNLSFSSIKAFGAFVFRVLLYVILRLLYSLVIANLIDLFCPNRYFLRKELLSIILWVGYITSIVPSDPRSLIFNCPSSNAIRSITNLIEGDYWNVGYIGTPLRLFLSLENTLSSLATGST